MNRKKAVSIIAMIMALLLLLSLVASVIPVRAYAVTQEEIEALQAQKSEISAQLADCKERLNGLQSEQANVLQQKAALIEEGRLMQEKIDLNQAQIDMYDDMILEQAKVVEAAKNREMLQLRKYRTRVRAMEENDGYNILTLVLQTSNLGELMSAVDDVGEIMESDRLLEEQYVASREETEEVKANYEAIKSEYEAKEEELRAEQDELRIQMEQTNAALEALADEIERAIEEYKAKEAEEAAAAAEISYLIAEWDRQKAAMQAQAAAAQVVNADGTVTTVTEGASMGISGTGSLIWPVPSSMRVTSRYGNRADPFTGVTTYHSGIDIDGYGNEGGAVLASDSGMVITASANSGYGNYIIIDHGGMKTVYAHLSSINVSAGQSVSQGQTIGGLGSTGRATGTHLHFEVYVGEGRVDPASYFSGISYYNC